MKQKNIYNFLRITEEELKFILNNKHKYYLSYKISKRNGSKRTINAPQDGLKELQNIIRIHFLNRFRVNNIVHGFVNRRSPITNAKQHLKPKILIKIDVKDFFPNIRPQHIKNIFKYLLGTRIGKEIIDTRQAPGALIISKILTELVTYNHRLPQGAPTSPALTNLICLPLDKSLKELESPYKCTITRYADDITISSKTNKNLPAIIKPIFVLLKRNNFKINKKKLAVIRNCQQMRVTGIVVNEKINIDKTNKRNLRAELHNIFVNGICIDTLTYQKLRGRIEWVVALNPQYGKKLMNQLGKIKLMP